jgi:nucleotide-binding universal stress UspA family protein
MGDSLEHMFSFLRNQKSCQLSVLHVLTSENERALKALEMGTMQIRVDTEEADSPEEGISKYLDNNEVDMLIVCHRHNTRLDYLFSRSTTKKLAGSIRVPMIIMPG